MRSLLSDIVPAAPGGAPGRSLRAGAIAVLVAVALLTACARPVAVESDRSALAAIEVHNLSGVSMIVSYEAAGASRATLGAVPPGGSERFIITLPAGTSIQVFGTSEGGDRQSGPYTLALQAGATQRVTLR